MRSHTGHPCRHSIYYFDKWVYSMKGDLPLHCSLLSSFILHITESLPLKLLSPRKSGSYLSLFLTELWKIKLTKGLCVWVCVCVHIILTLPFQHVIWHLLSSSSSQKTKRKEKCRVFVVYFVNWRVYLHKQCYTKGKSSQTLSRSQW